MSSGPSHTQHSDTPKKTSLPPTNNSYAPSSPTHTQPGSPTLRKHIQTNYRSHKNTALRIATGCTNTTPIQHLHDETQVLPLMDNMNMRGTQQYTSTFSPTHPLHYMQTPTATPRHIHNTPAEHFHSLYLSLPPCPEGLSERAHIHREFTGWSLDTAPPNSLLDSRPPPGQPPREHAPQG